MKNSRPQSLARYLSVAFFALLSLVLFSSCASRGPGKGDRLYDSTSNGQTITSHVGENFTVRLSLNITTGAKWEIVSLDQSILKQEGEPRATGNIVVGGLARIYSYYYNFKALSRGETKLVMHQIKEGKEEPIDTYEVTIVVE